MTVDNVTQILNKIPGDKWEDVTGGRFGLDIPTLDIPRPLREEIQIRYSTDTEKNHATADYYVNCHPRAEWGDIIETLYYEREIILARETKKSLILYLLVNTATIP